MMTPLGSYFNAFGLTDQASEREGGVWYSEPEIRLAEALRARGFRFEQQVRVDRPQGSAVLDFLVERRLAVEVDGREFHDAEKDSQRDLDVRIGERIDTLRLPAWKVMRDPEGMVCLIALRLSERGFTAQSFGPRAIGGLNSERSERGAA